MKDNKYSVYGLYSTQDIEKTVRYVGCTKDTKTRLSRHLNNRKDVEKYKWIIKNDKNINMKIYKTFDTIEEGIQYEFELTNKLSKINNLLNKNAGNNHSQETKLKMIKNHKGMINKKHSEFTKKKMSKKKLGEQNGMYNKKHTAETKLKMSLAKTKS